MIQGCAVLTLTFLSVALVPYAGPLVLVLTPLPFFYYGSRLNRTQGLMVLAVSFLTAYGFLSLSGQNPKVSILFLIAFGGMLFSEVLKRNFSIEKTISLTSLALFCGVAAMVLYHALRIGIAPWEMIETNISSMIEENLKLYAQMNISNEQVQIIRDNAPQFSRFFTGIFPALMLSGIVLAVWTNLLVGRRIFQANGAGFPNFGDLTRWKAPDRLVWVLIAAGCLLFVPLEGSDIIGMNLLIMTCVTYLFQGLAISAFFFRRKRVPKVLRLLFYGLILVQQYMIIVVVAFGLFDLWVDFRKRIGRVNDAHL